MSLLFLLAACALFRKAPAPWPDEIPPSAERPVVVGAGMVSGGLFMDGTYPFWMSVLPGWRARPGDDDGALRVSLNHPASGARVDVWTFDGDDLAPRSREGCLWTFESIGHYEVPRVSGPVMVATCMPDDPTQARILAYVLLKGDRVWQLEVHAPPHALLESRRLGDELIGTARWGR